MGLGSSDTKFVGNLTMYLLWMIVGVIYQLNSLLKVQAFTLFCEFFFCATMTFQARFTCLQAVLSFVRFSAGFSAAVFLLLVLHIIQKATLEPAFGVSSGAGTEHPDLLHTDAWQLKQ